MVPTDVKLCVALLRKMHDVRLVGHLDVRKTRVHMSIGGSNGKLMKRHMSRSVMLVIATGPVRVLAATLADS